MNVKKYGNNVKPVKQSKKRLVLVKPKVMELKKIYSQLAKSATWQRLDVYARAIQWYRNALQYIESTSPTYSAPVSRSLNIWANAVAHLNPNLVQKSEEHFIRALIAGQSICKAFGIKAPSHVEYLKKGKVVAKKLDAKTVQMTTKYDKLLTLLTQAYGSGLTLKVSPTLTTTHKYDHNIKTLYYSTAKIRQVATQLRTEGLLSVVINEASYIARAQCFQTVDKGCFLAEPLKLLIQYQNVLDSFVTWAATSQYAPKSLVRRKLKTKKKKPEAMYSSIKGEHVLAVEVEEDEDGFKGEEY